MRKFLLKVFTLISLAFLAPNLLSAEEYTVDIDNVDNVVLDIDDVPVTGLINGVNKVETGTSQYLRVSTKPGVVFTEVTLIDTYYNEENDWLNQVCTYDDGRQYVDLHSTFPDDESFRIRTQTSADARTASYTVTIDDPAKAALLVLGQPVSLSAGENVVKFNPAAESKVEIQPLEYTSIYSLTLNGQEVTRERYNYDLTVSDGDQIVITTTYPDIDCKITFDMSGADLTEFIREVDVNGKAELNWSAPGFTVKSGSELTLRGRTDEYEVLGFLVNGKPETFSAETKLFIVEDTELTIDVRKYASFMITLNVDVPANLKAYRGYANNGDLIDLSEGDNLVEVRRDTPFVTLVPADGFHLESITVTDQPDYTVEELTGAQIKVGMLTDNNVVTVRTAKIVRDKKAAIFTYDFASAGEEFNARRADLSNIELAEGATLIDFYDRDNTFVFANPASVSTAAYLNDEPLAAEGYYFYADLADGDAVKFFFGCVPSKHTVTVEAEQPEAFTLVRDHVRSIAPETFTALTSTPVTVTPAEGAQIEVTLDGKPLEADADGAYTFAVDSDKTLAVKALETGISEINAADATEAYDLLGRRIASTPRGLHIRAGRLRL